jgi:hypothetical protein
VGSELFETAFGHYPALVQYINIIELGEQVKAVDGGNNGLIVEGAEQAFVDHRLRAGVYAAGRFVEQDHAAVAGGEDASGEGEPLLLAAGEVDPFFADIGLEALGQVLDDFGKMGAFADPEDLGFAEREAEGDILGDGVLEDLRFLGEKGNSVVEAVEPGAGVGVRGRGAA